LMIWRSVVGKLWGTILALVSVVLLFLTMLLLQFFEDFHVQEVEKQMKGIAAKVAAIVSEDPHSQKALSIASQIIDVYGARAVIIERNQPYWITPKPHDLPSIDPELIKNDRALSKVLTEHRSVVKSHFTLPGETDKAVVVGVPIRAGARWDGGVFVYQSLDVVRKTTDQAKKIIYISAGIAIILTTIFAFFLSTRITAPLRMMRQAAQQVAKGKFNTEVPVLTRDEIGELGVAFNQMARQLKMHMTALSQEKEQLAGILSSMADGVMTFNKDGELLITNPPAERFLTAWAYEENEEPNGGADETKTRPVPAPIQELFHRVVDEEKEQVTEAKAQGRTWVIVMTPLYDQSIVRGAVAVLRDMTEERQLDEMRKGFIANVSHELRTPIAMLQGYSEAIVDDVAGSDEEKREIAKIIYDESLRMGRLVNELLDLARMETGHFQLNKMPVKIGEFFKRAVGKFQAYARDEGLKLTLEGPARGDEEVVMDPDRIEQVLTNLIDNAIRHTPKGGEIAVLVNNAEDRLVISVKDTGTGIDEDDLPFVFERFYKADKARTRGKAGTGLGLAIAKNIVEAHRGKIMVQSKRGHGTTFTFYIPKSDPS